jgi:hypothetical protein
LALSVEANEKFKVWAAALPREEHAFLKSADAHRTKKGMHVYYWNCVCEEVRRSVEGFLCALPAAEFYYCRVGDRIDDNEESGTFPDPFDLRLCRKVTLG